MDRSFVIAFLSQRLRKSCKSHRIMGVSDGKALLFPEESTNRWYKCFAKNNRSNCNRSQQGLFIVECFRFLADGTCIKCLEIVGVLPIPVQPPDKPGDCLLQFLS